MEVIAQLNSIPTTKDDVLGTKQGLSSTGKSFDLRAKIAYLNRPLKRIAIQRASIAE
jgi:hypothetical protein